MIIIISRFIMWLWLVSITPHHSLTFSAVDLKGKEDDSSTTIAQFKCSAGYDDEKNGGFSPVLDAFFFCTASSSLYRGSIVVLVHVLQKV